MDFVAKTRLISTVIAVYMVYFFAGTVFNILAPIADPAFYFQNFVSYRSILLYNPVSQLVNAAFGLVLFLMIMALRKNGRIPIRTLYLTAGLFLAVFVLNSLYVPLFYLGAFYGISLLDPFVGLYVLLRLLLPNIFVFLGITIFLVSAQMAPSKLIKSAFVIVLIISIVSSMEVFLSIYGPFISAIRSMEQFFVVYTYTAHTANASFGYSISLFSIVYCVIPLLFLLGILAKKRELPAQVVQGRLMKTDEKAEYNDDSITVFEKD